MTDGIDALEAMVERLRDDLRIAGDRMALAETGKRVLEANVVALHDTVAELRAENARLRGEVEKLTEHKRLAFAIVERHKDDLARVTAENVQLRGEVEAAWRDNDVLRRDLAVVGEEKARLRGEVESVKSRLSSLGRERDVLYAQVGLTQADLARVTGERDGLKMFADGVAEGDCHYGDACPTFGSRHGKCVVCQAREALAACAPPAKERP